MGWKVRINPELRPHGGIIGRVCAVTHGETPDDRRLWLVLDVGDDKPLMWIQKRNVTRIPDASSKEESPLEDALNKANAKYAAMTPEERAAMWQAQRESWARGEMALGLENGKD